MTRRSLTGWRSAILGALGLSVSGCGGATGTNDATSGSGGSEDGGRVAIAGGTPNGGSSGNGVSGGNGGAAVNPLLACDDPKPLFVDGEATGYVRCDADEGGWWHRAERRDCPSRIPRSDYEAPLAGSCKTDADCTATALSHCGSALMPGMPAGGDMCPPPVSVAACVEGCIRDEDCGSGQVCLCGDPIGTCVDATCDTDADCGGLLCASTGMGWSLALGLMPKVGFACQTADSNCTGESRCKEAPQQRCQEHRCTRGPVCGRPFLVLGERRVANGIAAPDDWARNLPDVAPAISEAARARVGKYFADVALLEHASVAAFARFVLELLSLGAPAQLVHAAQRAMGDEIEHAQLCFGLARSFGSEIQAPGPLALHGALAESKFKDIVERAILEACIGETLAAVEAAEALEAACSPEVRRALERIAADEAEHALLGFRFVGWALSQAAPELRLELRATLRDLVASELRRASALPQIQVDEDLSDYGLLPEQRLRALRIAVLREVIQPVVNTLDAAAPCDPSPRLQVESC